MQNLYLVRHGQTNANKERYIGSLEEPLNETGEQQAQAVAERLSHVAADIVLDSGWKRAQQTAASIRKTLQLPQQTVAELGEHTVGPELDNQPYTSDIVTEYAAAVADSWSDRDFHHTGTDENFFDLQVRAQRLQAILEAMPEENIIAVTHSRFLRFFTGHMLLQDTLTPAADLQMSQVLKPTNTGITHFTFVDGVWQLKIFNDHAHFAE